MKNCVVEKRLVQSHVKLKENKNRLLYTPCLQRSFTLKPLPIGDETEDRRSEKGGNGPIAKPRTISWISADAAPPNGTELRGGLELLISARPLG